MKTTEKNNPLRKKAVERDRDKKYIPWGEKPEFISKNSHRKTNKRK